jgi:hypothetical protein
MFCPSCASEVNPGLSYCNQCGMRLSAPENPRVLPASSFNKLLASVVGIPLAGVAMIFVFIAALKNGMGFRDDFIFAMIFLTFLLLAIAEIGCVIMLITRTKGPKTSKNGSDLPISKRHELNEASRLGLGSPTFEPRAVGSVTDHTTRTLDHAALRDEK